MPTPVQAVGADTGSGTTTSLAVNFAAPTAGNLLVGVANSDATIATPSGWTLYDSAVSNQGTYLFYRIAVGDETSVSFVPSVADTVAGAVLEYPQITASPADVSAHDNRTSSSNVTALTGTTGVIAQATELVVVVAGPHSYSAGVAPTSPTWVTATNRISQATVHGTGPINVALFVGDYTTSATGTQSETCTWTNSSQDAGGIIGTFKVSSITGDVSVTVTASATVTAANAAVGSASPTVAADATVSATIETTGAVAETITASTIATGANSASGSVSQTVTAAATVEAVVGSIISETVTTTITVEAAVTSPRRGSWQQLISILRDARDQARVEATRVPVACPNDGTPLTPSPDGGLFCKFDGWAYPRDWIGH